jgi:hypothetical protein
MGRCGFATVPSLARPDRKRLAGHAGKLCFLDARVLEMHGSPGSPPMGRFARKSRDLPISDFDCTQLLPEPPQRFFFIVLLTSPDLQPEGVRVVVSHACLTAIPHIITACLTAILYIIAMIYVAAPLLQMWCVEGAP